jgi:hypothetical protein
LEAPGPQSGCKFVRIGSIFVWGATIFQPSRGICGQSAESSLTRGPNRGICSIRSPGSTRETDDGLGSPDGFRPKTGQKREAGGVTGPISSVRMKKEALGGYPGDEWRCSKSRHALPPGTAIMAFFYRWRKVRVCVSERETDGFPAVAN